MGKSKINNQNEKINPLTEEPICCADHLEKEKSSSTQNRTHVNLLDYIPNLDKPIKFICVNLHVFQDSTGQKNYTKSHIKEFRLLFFWINGYFLNKTVPNYVSICNNRPVLPQQVDSRIRFILNRIEFYQDDNLCNQGYRNYAILANAMRQRDASMDEQLNIFLTNPDLPQIAKGYVSGFPSANLAVKQYIHTFKSKHHQVPHIFLSKHWAHELAHALGLYHTYDSSICNENDPFYLYDIHGCSPTKVCPIPTTIPNNNIMAGKESSSISTLQIATMHYKLENLSVGRYANGICCPKCVAFGASIFRHKSSGPSKILEYEKTLANEPWAWDGRSFTCPVDGIYHFGISFQKDSLIDGGTSKSVWIKLWADWDLIGTVWSEKADARTDGIVNLPQSGRRDSVSFTTNIKLKKGTIIKTEVGAHNNEKRHLVDINFNGHLLCSDCC